MEHYPEKLIYLYKRQKYTCPICGEYMNMNEALDMHHKMSNTKWARKSYPLFIDSVLNLALVHSACHLNKVGGLRVTPYNAERFERFLKNHKKTAEFVNNPVEKHCNV